MGRLSEAKLDIVRGLIEQAPDTALRNLLRALAMDGPHDDSLTRVQLLLEIEASDRNTRNMALSGAHAQPDLEGAQAGSAA